MQSPWSAPVTVNVGSAAVPVISTPSTIPQQIVGISFLMYLQASNSPVEWELTAGAVPPGFTFNTTTGLLSGVPTTITGSPFTFSIRARNAFGWGSAVAFSMAVISAATPVDRPTITTAALPVAYIGVDYAYQIPAVGNGTITFTSTTLPSGWSLTSGGLLSKTNPTALSNYAVTVTPWIGANAGTPVAFFINVIAAPASPGLRRIADRSTAGRFTTSGRR